LDLKPGDEVILTDHEHVGNADPWLNRKRKDGITIKVLNLKATQEQCLEDLTGLITPRTRVIAVPHVTCTTGQVLPIKEICTMAREKGILTFIDGAHGVGMMNLDLKALGCDIYASCGHKWLLGPKGTGILYVRKELIEELDALFIGSYTDDGWIISTDKSELSGLKNTAHRFYYGTQNTSLYAGLEAAVNFMESVGPARVEARVRELNQMLYSELASLDGIEILTPEEKVSRCGMVSFRFGEKTVKWYGKMKAEKWVIRFVPESGLDCIRVSTHIYNSESDIKRFIEKVKSR
ncbi:MAG: aminotransferase class V-fold PLP-dependent enzyme, partial [Bacteroidia bacterium]|nr:aminotransferase class V-fold PLP-dependent enzyme [Bacteroidia bacterium]